jgi:hypothetical protein
MLRTRMLSAIPFLLLTFALAGCSVDLGNGLKAGGGAGGTSPKPTSSDLSGKVLQFSGHWEGPCAVMMGGVEHTACTAILDIRQTPFNSLAIDSSMTISLAYNIDNALYPTVHLPVYAITNNNVADLNGQQVGQIGQGGMRFLSDKFVVFSMRALEKDRTGSVAQQIAIGTSRLPGISVDNCSNNVCFSAVLNPTN